MGKFFWCLKWCAKWGPNVHIWLLWWAHIQTTVGLGLSLAFSTWATYPGSFAINAEDSVYETIGLLIVGFQKEIWGLTGLYTVGFGYARFLFIFKNCKNSGPTGISLVRFIFQWIWRLRHQTILLEFNFALSKQLSLNKVSNHLDPPQLIMHSFISVKPRRITHFIKTIDF